eukprot:jgi/Tetstr1/448453/TSEL_035721.t1
MDSPPPLKRVILKANAALLSCTKINTPHSTNTKKQYCLRTDLAARVTPHGEEAFLLISDIVYHFASADRARECYVHLIQSAALYVTGGTDTVRAPRLPDLIAKGEAALLEKDQFATQNIVVVT